MSETPPLTPDQWLIARIFRDRLGLTYREVGDVLGKSPSLVKQYIHADYEFYRTPGGGWARRKRKEGGGGAPGNTGPRTS